PRPRPADPREAIPGRPAATFFGLAGVAVRIPQRCLRGAVDAAGAPALVRELDARQRQSARPGDIGSQPEEAVSGRRRTIRAEEELCRPERNPCRPEAKPC
ncbi:hypothetical protein, partial [Actinacidiphila acididurans]